MDLFEKNMRCLEEYRPELFRKLVNFKPSKYTIIPTRHPKKYPNLLHIASDSIAYNPNDPFDTLLNELKRKIHLPVLNLFFGFGLGYELILMLQHFVDKESVYIVVDPELEPFYHAMRVVDYEAMIKDKRVFLLIGEDDKNMYLLLHDILMMRNLKFYVKAVNIIDNSLSIKLNTQYYKNVMAHLKDAIKNVLLHFGNDPWDSLIGIENTFVNINEIIQNPGIKDLKNKFENKPGIVVATGPSLNKNIELLRGLEDKAVICAADASLRVMKKYGLKPHLVTSLERVIATSKLFEGLTADDVKDVYLSACPVIRPETYANFPGERIIVYRNFATFKWLDIEKGILDIGPSSANMAFKILEFLGCNPIILIGQDLAFGENDVTHASGATFGEKEQQYYSIDILEVEGNFVPKIKTTGVWYQFLKFYEKDVANFKGKVVNATEGGAKIPGTEIMTFREAIDRYINGNIGVLDTIKKSLVYPSPEEIKFLREKMKSKVIEALEYADEVIFRLEKGKILTEKFTNEVIKKYEESGQVDSKLYEELFVELQKPLQIFSEMKFYEIFAHFVQSYFITSMVEINGVVGSDLPGYKKNFSTVALLDDMYLVMIKLIMAMKNSMLNMKRELEKYDS
ncbi:motility associated factor glycosyltransferase family protein [Calditerrivibrio nitroreducens]|uniref:Motility accessory factor n=1 Tax=Calditerrivibrio nitroreducens (strain DSM 19672 / NBRC 101217 / Yu37-1) TaxID=768670 RepID=E4TGF4_CALNY|nr:6-hydroxymethylpterin diphosphokinase MptE-like protein [Calditerrivibrio nitroreducens]ADR18635.1 protein of unknown function DUF115 [Calditerrivibrio nitroreducens DSM 19672]